MFMICNFGAKVRIIMQIAVLNRAKSSLLTSFLATNLDAPTIFATFVRFLDGITPTQLEEYTLNNH